MKMATKSILLTACLLVCGTAAMAQSKKTGVITDANGEPLIGVTVKEVGTSNGVITDVDGRYSITTTKPNAKLEVSYVGYVPQTITPGQSVQLKEDAAQLNEVVVVGYGTMRRKDVTSSITTVDAKDLNTGVYTDPAQLLQGKVAGLVVTNTADPSGSPSVTLRGASTLRTGEAQEPYYVIDGVPGVDLSLVSPDDIESIDVLRDATATAIYGSKAANGVIIITTKKGKSGTMHVNYSAYVAFDRVAKNLDMMSADELRAYAAANDYELNNDEGANTDWQKEVQQTGIAHSHNVSINGGNDKTSYNASINYINREGVIKGSKMNRVNGRALVSTNVLKDHLKLSLGFNLSEGHFRSVQMGDDGASVLDAMNYYSPCCPVYNADGTYYAHLSVTQNFNPVAMINQDKFQNIRRRYQITTNAILTLLPGLTWTVNYSYMNHQNIYSAYNSIDSQLTEGLEGLATRNTYQGHKQVFETFGNWTKTFGQVHNVGLMVGYSWEEKTDNDGFGLSVHNFYNDDVGWYNLTYANQMNGIDDIQSGSVYTLRMISFFARANYSFNSKYNFQATIRRDGSSAFGKNNRWATFPSVSAAWRLSEEKFIKDLNFFDDLKLRMGYGVSGNSLGFDAYTALQTYGASGWFTYTTSSGETLNYHTLAATSNSNPDLKWEKTGMFNVGLDFAFFNGRLSGTIEYYDKRTSDLIYYYPVSTNRYPYGTMTANVGKISNKGIEVTINAVPVKTKDFQWQTMLNFSHNKNNVEKLSNQEFSVDYIDTADPHIAGFSNATSVQRIMEGQPLGTFYTWEFAGFDENGKSLFYEHDAETNERTGTTTDDPQDKDRTIVGCAQPDLTMGWNNTLTYKKWSLTMFFTGVFGNDIFNCSRAQYNNVSFVASDRNVLKEVATEQHFGDDHAQAPSDRYLEDGSYFRLSSLTLGYNFGKIGDWLQGITVYATANNLFTITGYKGLDPEVSLGGIDPGMEYRQTFYPHTRSYMIGLKVNF
jgi:TonB-linked SusC/RagA family outer membrane protein